MKLKQNLPCAVLIFVSALSNVAMASGGADVMPTARVKLADLDLNTPDGISTLYARIKHAARRVCEAPGGTRMIGVARTAKECRALTTDSAVRQLALPPLTRLHHASFPAH